MAPSMSAAPPPSRSRWLTAAALVAGLFGLASIVSGGRVLFGPEEARVAAGHYVPLVLWFNFFAGFAYVAGAVGLALARPWATVIAIGVAVTTAVVHLAFVLHVVDGGAFETRTAVAMALRTGLWAVIAVVSCRHLGCCRLHA